MVEAIASGALEFVFVHGLDMAKIPLLMYISSWNSIIEIAGDQRGRVFIAS